MTKNSSPLLQLTGFTNCWGPSIFNNPTSELVYHNPLFVWRPCLCLYPELITHLLNENMTSNNCHSTCQQLSENPCTSDDLQSVTFTLIGQLHLFLYSTHSCNSHSTLDLAWANQRACPSYTHRHVLYFYGYTRLKESHSKKKTDNSYNFSPLIRITKN